MSLSRVCLVEKPSFEKWNQQNHMGVGTARIKTGKLAVGSRSNDGRTVEEGVGLASRS